MWDWSERDKGVEKWQMKRTNLVIPPFALFLRVQLRVLKRGGAETAEKCLDDSAPSTSLLGKR
jgi:hypothetical protein